MRASSARTVASASSERPPTCTSRSATLKGTFISPRMFRSASTTPSTGPKPRSAASSTGPTAG